jgi:CDP-6-deoxy-D-xylo-4-hexulose-3-dehydrase
MDRDELLQMVKAYYTQAFLPSEFVPGETPIHTAARVLDSDDLVHLVDAALDLWLTADRYADQFEHGLAQLLGIRYAILCNSGSSANLLSLSALTSSKLGKRRLQPSDEVITIAAGFPTTVNPIIQSGLIPVFVDIELGTLNVDVNCLEEAISPRTRAIILPHTLGNPFDVDSVLRIAKERNLWLVEDNCDSLGSTYKERLTGTFGDLATCSFYPAHHITMGEGGCVLTNQSKLAAVVKSFRDWGRDCRCKPGQENTCGKRFKWEMGRLPYGYDHKYIYSHIGYNLKLTDMQAAVGVAQLKKLPRFIELRKRNWQLLHKGLKPFKEFLILSQPTPNSDPSWFGFAITIRPEAPFDRHHLIRYLRSRKIDVRLLFGGNLTRQPAYQSVPYRTVGGLKNTDVVMNQTFWIGVYPGLTEQMITYMVDTLSAFIREQTGVRLR